MIKIITTLTTILFLTSCGPFQKSEEAVRIKVDTASKSLGRDIKATVTIHNGEKPSE
ncbi:MAG: hypothetical protein ACTSQE_12345 [Candidatus Heimdallarchaeaceae archaeon]